VRYAALEAAPGKDGGVGIQRNLYIFIFISKYYLRKISYSREDEDFLMFPLMQVRAGITILKTPFFQSSPHYTIGDRVS
jgi:hypothetical protein